MTEAQKDQYDDMTGTQLADELSKRELPVSGKVDELRTRLREDDEKRAQADADGPDDTPEGDDTEDQDVEVPEPREPVDYNAGAVVLNEHQARALTAGEARLRHFTKHVSGLTERKYCAGDRVTGIFDMPNREFLVLPFGVSIPLETGEQSEED